MPVEQVPPLRADQPQPAALLGLVGVEHAPPRRPAGTRPARRSPAAAGRRDPAVMNSGISVPAARREPGAEHRRAHPVVRRHRGQAAVVAARPARRSRPGRRRASAARTPRSSVAAGVPVRAQQRQLVGACAGGRRRSRGSRSRAAAGRVGGRRPGRATGTSPCGCRAGWWRWRAGRSRTGRRRCAASACAGAPRTSRRPGSAGRSAGCPAAPARPAYRSRVPARPATCVTSVACTKRWNGYGVSGLGSRSKPVASATLKISYAAPRAISSAG